LDKEGIEEFYNWIFDSPENKKLFFESKAIFESCSPHKDIIDIDKSWERLLDKKYGSQIPISNLWKNIRNYAATACIAIALTSASFIFFQHDTVSPIAEYVGGNGIEADIVILPDGTRVNVGSKTTFRCSPDYNNKNRVVYLEGEAMFEVAKQKDKPFIVKVQGQEIEALGTKFNVMAYPSDSIFTTTLLEGSISLITQNISKTAILTPNQQFTYNRNNNEAIITNVDASLYTSWVNGYYYFPNQTFQSILSRLSNVYGVKFEIKSEKLKNKKFTGTFYRGQNIQDILEIINISIPIKYEIKEECIIISQ